LVSKLNGACYAVRFMLHINNTWHSQILLTFTF
jgi:hypothetical protein